MSMLFRAKTQEGFIIKILSELLQNIIKTACLEIHQDGIKLCMMDSNRRILIHIHLHAHNFNIYELNQSKTLYLGINLTHFYRMLKAIKKKDALTFEVHVDKPHELLLIVTPKENNRVTTSAIHIQMTQNVDIPLPSGYGTPIIVPSSEYQQTLKDMNNMNDILDVITYRYSIKLQCSADKIYSREVMFGELDDESQEQYHEQFDMEQFIRVIKIAGLNKTIHIYSTQHLPLCLKTDIGQLGTISIFLKSRRDIEQEHH